MAKLTPEKAVVCGDYFDKFRQELKAKGFLLKVKKCNPKTGYCSFSTGVRDWVYVHEIGDKAKIFLYCRCKKVGEAEVMFKALRARKKTIQRKWDRCLDWDAWEKSSKSHKIGVECCGSLSDDKKSRTKTCKWAVEQMLKLKNSISQEMLEGIAAKVETEKSEE